MAAVDTYSKRKRIRERDGQPDVYQYDLVPSFLRTQVRLILEASLGPELSVGLSGGGDLNWQQLARVMEREVEGFLPSHGGSPKARCLFFLEHGGNTDDWLSLVELGCRWLQRLADEGIDTLRACRATQTPQDAIDEINTRFREHAFGYEFRNREIIRIDDQFLHAEAVKPALHLLSQPGFEKANEDFMLAHRHLRDGNGRDAIVAANRAFESTLKTICKARGWTYPEGARAGELVTAVRNNGIFPGHLGNGLDTYVAMMKTGLPSVRNNVGGHGADPEAPPVPNYLPSYAIHLTASNILLAISAHLEPP